MRQILYAWLILLLLAPSLHAQYPISPATGKETGMDWSVILSTPPTFTLQPKTPTAHPGSIWVRSTPEGLHLWGRISLEGSTPRWPRQKSEVLASDHIEVWLAAEDTVPLPPIGWGNQFGQFHLKSSAECLDLNTDAPSRQAAQHLCELWFAQQTAYRRTLPRLFARQWLLADGPGGSHVFEDFAATADRTLAATLFRDDQPTPLAPPPDDSVTAQFSAEYSQDPGKKSYQTAYTFHLVLPYSAFPPTRQFTLANLSLMVDVFTAAPDGSKMGAFSTTSSDRQWGKPATFNHVRLLAPPTYAITPCHANPVQTDLFGATYLSWFFPNASPNITSTFASSTPQEATSTIPAESLPSSNRPTSSRSPFPMA